MAFKAFFFFFLFWSWQSWFYLWRRNIMSYTHQQVGEKGTLEFRLFFSAL